MVIGYTKTYHMVSDVKDKVKLIVLFLVVYGIFQRIHGACGVGMGHRAWGDCRLQMWDEGIKELRDLRYWSFGLPTLRAGPRFRGKMLNNDLPFISNT